MIRALKMPPKRTSTKSSAAVPAAAPTPAAAAPSSIPLDDNDRHLETLRSMYPGVNVVIPNYSMKLSKSGSTVVFKVDLKKVPEQLINFQPTPTHIHLDTFKYSKKFVIHKEYPHNLTVDAGPDSYATVEYGLLTALLPVHGHAAATPNKLAGATSMVNRDARKRNRDDATEEIVAKKKKKMPKDQGIAEKKAAKAAMVAAAEAAVSKIADVTKAKAAVVNEKLEWEELDKQEQEQKKAAALARKGNAKAKLAEFADGKLKGEKLAKAKERAKAAKKLGKGRSVQFA